MLSIVPHPIILITVIVTKVRHNIGTTRGNIL